MSRDLVMEDESDKHNSSFRYTRGDTYVYPHREAPVDSDYDKEENEDLKEGLEGEDDFLKNQGHDQQRDKYTTNLVIRSKKQSVKNLKECERLGKDPHEETIEERFKKEHEAELYKENQQKVRELTIVIKKLILKLSSFTSMYVGTKFFYEQYATVMDMLERFVYDESQAMLLLSRSNTVLHQFISKVRNDLNKKLKKDYPSCDIRTVRINSILTTKETAILNHFAECLGMDN